MIEIIVSCRKTFFTQSIVPYLHLSLCINDDAKTMVHNFQFTVLQIRICRVVEEIPGGKKMVALACHTSLLMDDSKTFLHVPPSC